MIYRIGLTVALVGSALGFALPIADAFGMPKIAIALLGSAILWLACVPARFHRTELDRPILAFMAAFAISTAFSIDPWRAVLGTYFQPFHGAAALIPAILIFYAVAAEDWRWGSGAFYCAAVISAANGIVCLAQLAGAFQEPYNVIGGRALGSMGSPIFTGAVLAPCFAPCLWLAGRRSWIGYAGLAGEVIALGACGSRGPILAAGAGLLAFLAASGTLRACARHLAALGAILGLLAMFYQSPRIARSDSGRFHLWEIAARAGIERPIAGWGPDAFQIADRQIKTAPDDPQASAHNDLLQAWATMGGLGLAALIWLWAAALRRSLAHPAAYGAVVALFVVSKFNPTPPSAIYIVAAILGSVGFRLIASDWAPMFWALGVCAMMAIFPDILLDLRSEVLNSLGQGAIAAGNVVAASNFRRMANETSPRETIFAANRCELIFAIAKNYPEDRKKDFARRALRTAGAIVLAHPNDSSSFELMSAVEMNAAPILGRALFSSAVRSARRAVELNPHGEFSIQRLTEARGAKP